MQGFPTEGITIRRNLQQALCENEQGLERGGGGKEEQKKEKKRKT